MGTTPLAESGGSNEMEVSADAKEQGGLKASKPGEQDGTQEIAGPPQVPVKTTKVELPRSEDDVNYDEDTDEDRLP